MVEAVLDEAREEAKIAKASQTSRKNHWTKWKR